MLSVLFEDDEIMSITGSLHKSTENQLISFLREHFDENDIDYSSEKDYHLKNNQFIELIIRKNNKDKINLLEKVWL